MPLLALALLAAPAAAATKQKSPADSPPPQLQKLLENCDAHKFETIIEVPTGALTKKSRLRLCGTEGQSDADWVRTLEDAVKKTEANAQMPKTVRDQIVAALNGEIARLGVSGSGLTGLSAPRAASKTPALDGISALPPLPEPKQAEPVAALPPPPMIAPSSPSQEYAALPPLPTTVTAPTHVLPGATALLPALPRPRMQFICYNPGDVGEGPCAEFARDTMLTVRADEDLPSGTSLRFVRNGDARADVELAQLRKGKTQQFVLPPEVCSHVSSASLEIRIVRAVKAAGPSGQEVGKDGPYNLRC
jgi:hypothetical protein